MKSLTKAIRDIEAKRGSRAVLLAASHLDLDLLPALHDMLNTLDNASRMDVLLYCKGGEITAARRIGLLLGMATEHLGAIVPDRCQSAGTIVALAAREIIAGPAAIFSPVDPALQAPLNSDEGSPSAISTEDVRRFSEMAQSWFGHDKNEADAGAFTAMTAAIFPPTLTAFYRATLEVRAICHELLRLHRPASDEAITESIVSRLMFGYHSHGFPLSRDDLMAMGLPIVVDSDIESASWVIAGLLRQSIGGGARASLDDDWFDACIATRDDCRVRRTGSRLLMPRWERGVVTEDGVQAISPS